MKRTFFLLLSAAMITLGMSSCSREEPTVSFKTVLINVGDDMWKYPNPQLDEENFFYATVKMPEITNSVFDKGLVKMYRVFDFDSRNAMQMEMPYTRLREYYYDDIDFQGQPVVSRYTYMEHVFYEIAPGHITIKYMVSDFDYETDLEFWPEPMQFRCVVVY